MEKIDKLGSAKRFGSRYGSKPKHKFAKIEKEQRKKHKCPYCNNVAVKRVAMGIWHCRKCNSKFTGKAYTISKSISFGEPIKDETSKEETSEVETSKEETSKVEASKEETSKENLETVKEEVV